MIQLHNHNTSNNHRHPRRPSQQQQQQQRQWFSSIYRNHTKVLLSMIVTALCLIRWICPFTATTLAVAVVVDDHHHEGEGDDDDDDIIDLDLSLFSSEITIEVSNMKNELDDNDDDNNNNNKNTSTLGNNDIDVQDDTTSWDVLLHDDVDNDDENDKDKHRYTYDDMVEDFDIVDDNIITVFHSIQDVYTELQEQQMTPIQSIYWMILLLQDDECSSTTATFDTKTLYHDAAQQIQEWNNDWYPPNTDTIDDSARDSNHPTTTTATVADMVVPYIHIGQLYLQSDSDKEIIISQLGIVTTPSIVLLSTQRASNVNVDVTTQQQPASADHNTKSDGTTPSPSFGPIYVVEYTGIQSTSMGMAHGVRHYFDTISHLRSQPQQDKANTTTTTNVTSPLVLIEPQHFPSIQHLQSYIVTYWQRLFHIVSNESLSSSYANRMVLSQEKVSNEGRLYIRWLFDDNVGTTTIAPSATSEEQIDDHEFVLLIIQCRVLDEAAAFYSSNSQQDLYNIFDTMARTIQARRDVLFLVVQQPASRTDDWCNSDGSISVYEIPNWQADIDSTIELLSSRSTTEWKDAFVSYQYDATSTELLLKNDDPLHDSSNSRLVEFLVKVCTDNVLWFDRQMVAPIAFPTYRKVHAVLVVDMHHDIMHIATETYKYADNDGTTATNSSLLLDDHPRSLMNRRSVNDFRRTCRKHRVQYMQSLLDYDMVCLIIPSTETRILTTFGMTELWTQMDSAVDHFNYEILEELQQNSGTNRNDEISATLPRLLITDQRHGGTRRYYKDLVPVYDASATNDANPIDDYVTQFWQNELHYEVKSGSPPMNEVNPHGIHILSANTIVSKLYNNCSNRTDPTTTTNNSCCHALILFTTSTCGHCKRIWNIWNRFGRLLQSIGWDSSVLQLYQIDVSENDIAATPLNVSINWVPDIYYLSPDRTKQIRYNVTDELGDTVGGIRDPLELITWLIHDVGDDFIDTKGVEQLLFDLENKLSFDDT